MNPFISRIRQFLRSRGIDVVRIAKMDDETRYKLSMYRRLYHTDSLVHRRFYNIGSGSFYHPFWTNLDYVSDWYKPYQADVVHINLMEQTPLPIADSSAEAIYTSHTIEHVSEDAVQNCFNECFRALKSGGYFRVTTGPDADSDFQAMQRNDHDWYYWLEAYDSEDAYREIFHMPPSKVAIEEKWLHHVATELAPHDKSPSLRKYCAEEIRSMLRSGKTKEELLDFFTAQCSYRPAYPGNHISWWNADKIKRFLSRAGFTNMYTSAYSQSHCPVMRDTQFFDNTHPQISVYVEAQK